MAKLDFLTASDEGERRILEHLEANASDALVEKIRASGRTLRDAVDYCATQAKPRARHNAAYVCETEVFGWVVHYFEDVAAAKPAQAAKEKTPKAPKEKKAKAGGVKRFEAKPEPAETPEETAADPEEAPEAGAETEAAGSGSDASDATADNPFAGVKLF